MDVSCFDLAKRLRRFQPTFRFASVLMNGCHALRLSFIPSRSHKVVTKLSSLRDPPQAEHRKNDNVRTSRLQIRGTFHWTLEDSN